MSGETRVELSTTRQAVEEHGWGTVAQTLAEGLEPDLAPALPADENGLVIAVGGQAPAAGQLAPTEAQLGPAQQLPEEQEARPRCGHDTIAYEVVTAEIRSGENGSGLLLRREAKLRLVCAGCGQPARFRFGTGGPHPSRTDGELGLVASFDFG